MSVTHEIASGSFGARVEHEIVEHVVCEFREDVATFVFMTTGDRPRVVVPADVYIAFLQDIRAKADLAKRS